MKQREISMILSDCGEDYVDLKILDVDLPEVQQDSARSSSFTLYTY